MGPSDVDPIVFLQIHLLDMIIPLEILSQILIRNLQSTIETRTNDCLLHAFVPKWFYVQNPRKHWKNVQTPHRGVRTDNCLLRDGSANHCTTATDGNINSAVA